MNSTPPAFRFQSQKVHLTYKTHVDFDKLIKMATEYGPLHMMSIAHELGDTEEADPMPYAHTHAFFWWKKRLDKTNARVFDIDEIHPHIKCVRALAQTKTIVMRYHWGHKTKADGKKYYIAPVAVKQLGVEDWKLEETAWERARDAPSLFDAAMDIGVEVKTLGDIKSVRGAGIKRGFAEVEYDCTHAWIKPPSDWDKKKRALVLLSAPGCGKTNWAKAQFNKPFVIEDIDDLKHIPEGCDGLVFDDCEFAHLKLATQKKLADVRVPTTIHARHINAHKPHLPAIFTTNNLATLFDLNGDNGAVAVRTQVWDRGIDNMYYTPCEPEDAI